MHIKGNPPRGVLRPAPEAFCIQINRYASVPFIKRPIRGAAMDGQDRRHVLECRPKVQGGPDGHSHQWLHSVFPATLVLVEQKVKVSLPSASNSLLTDCIARGPRPRDIKAHISIQAAPQWLGLRLACPGGACWETARDVLTAPTTTTTSTSTRAIQSRVWKRL